MDIAICKIRMTLVHLCGPNSDNPEYYQSILGQIKLFNNKYVLGGDWNLVVNPNIDTYNYVNFNNLKARDEVLKIIDELDLNKYLERTYPRIAKFYLELKYSIEISPLIIIII